MGLFKKDKQVCIEQIDKSVIVKMMIDGTLISKMGCVVEPNNKLLIGDIMPFRHRKYFNKGYGTLMMNSLLKFASENSITTVYGHLSIVDRDHKDRLHAFYKKNGFEIVEYAVPQNLFYGEVVKEL